MMNSIVPALVDWGVPKKKIHFEAFGPASIKGFELGKAPDTIPEVAPAGDAAVNFLKSQKTITWTPEAGSLLDLARANGIPIDSGCCAGECLTCETAMISGEVRYIKDPSEAPDRGSCLPCICVPAGDLKLNA